MGLLEPANGAAYLKAGFMGSAGAGKTFSACDVAIETRAYFGLTGPIAMFDTENGSDYLRDIVRARTGKELLRAKRRSLDDLITVAHECVSSGVSVLVVDSITHVWREVCDTYLAQKKRIARDKNWKVPDSLDFQDWGPIKERWAKWTEFFLNSSLHVIVCGRLGYDWDFEMVKGKKELVKTGTKMKAEGEFGYEPSLLVEMEQEQADEGSKVRITATIKKDRFDKIMFAAAHFTPGKAKPGDMFRFVLPHVEMLKGGAHVPIADTRTRFELDENGDEEGRRRARERAIVLEKIEAELKEAWGGRSKEETQARGQAMEDHFGSKSWTEISKTLPLETLQRGYTSLVTEADKRLGRPPRNEPAPVPAAVIDDEEPDWMKGLDEGGESAA